MSKTKPVQAFEQRSKQRIIALILEGKGNKEISDILCIAVCTVKFHKTALFKKFKVRNGHQLVVKLMQAKIDQLQSQLDTYRGHDKNGFINLSIGYNKN